MDKKFSSKTAFSLAEILIVVGVIGVVAAITLSILEKNYQKFVLVKQLKRSYATLQQGFRKMLADEGLERLDDTQTFLALNNSFGCARTNGDTMMNCDDFYENLKKYFLISEIDDSYSFPTSNAKIYLSDGSYILQFRFRKEKRGNDSSKIKSLGEFWIDVNGNKKPNQNGLDRFRFFVSQDGMVYPYGSKQSSMMEYGDENTLYWRTNVHYANACYVKNGTNTTCAGRVLEKGKIDY